LVFLVICLIVFLVTYVVPNFAILYQSMQAQLPAATLILIAVGTTARSYVLIGFAALIGAIFAFRWWARTPAGGEMVDRFFMSEWLNDHERTIKTCTLRPGGVDVSRLPLAKIAQGLDSGGLSVTMQGWVNLARTLYALRATDLKQSLEWLEQAREKAGASPRGATCLAIAAIIQQKQGDIETAKQSLAEADKLINAAVPKQSDGTIDYPRLYNVPNWGDWLNAEIFRREAAAALGG